MTLGQLARQIHYSKSYLSKVENGWKPASLDLARRCDAALGAGGELAALAVRPSGRTGSATLAAGPETEHGGVGEVWEVTWAADGTTRFVRRRDVLITGVAGAVSLLDAGVGGRGISAAAREETTVRSFWSMFDQTRRLGQQTPPGVVLPVLIGQTQAVRGLAARASGPARAELLGLAARYAEFTGWMAQETGDDRATVWWTDLAAQLATAAGDRDLASYTEVRRAEVALYGGNAARTIELAAAIRADHSVSPRVRSMAAQREAQGHALANDYDACRRSLNAAALLLDRDGDAAGRRSGLGSSALANPIAMVTGWCLLDVGRPGESAEMLRRELDRIPAAGRRARARFGARLAVAHAVSGDVEAACAAGHRALDDAEYVDSATIRHDLRRLSRALSRWHSRPPVRDLSPRLVATLRAPVDL